jgi:hypothetical protein
MAVREGLRRTQMDRVWTFGAIVLGIGGCGSEEPAVATAAELVSRLEGATAGDTIRLDTGRFEGEFEVPAGVELRGSGRGATILAGVEGGVVLTIQPGDGETTIRDLTIETGVRSVPDEVGDDADGDGRLEFATERAEVGVLAVDSADLLVERVDVEVATGQGIWAEGLASLRFYEVSATGRVNRDNATWWGWETHQLALESAPMNGVVVRETEVVRLDLVDASGFAQVAVDLDANPDTRWTGGRVCDNLGTSVLLIAGSATLESLQVCNMLEGFGLVPPYGIAVVGGALVTTTGLVVEGRLAGESIGILQDSSRAVHTGLTVVDNRGIGVAVQRSAGTAESPAFALLGDQPNDLSGNAFVGLALFETSGVRIANTTIDGTATLPMIEGDLAGVEVGDGIQIRRCLVGDCEMQLADIRLDSVALHTNGRAAMVIEAQNAPADGIVCGTVDVGDVGEYGAVVQNHTAAPQNWDSIAETGAERDLETVQGVNPEFLPGVPGV